MSQTFLEVQDLILGDDFDPTKYRARAAQAINDGLDMIARNATVPELETTWTVPTVAGTALYDLPDDLIRVRSVYDYTRRESLQEADAETFDNLLATQQGIPSLFMLFGRRIQFWPTPSTAATLKVRYLQGGADLTADETAITSIPNEYVYMLVAFGRSRLAAAEDDVELASFWRQEFDRDLALLRSDMGRRSTRRVRQIPGMWASSASIGFRRP